MRRLQRADTDNKRTLGLGMNQARILKALLFIVQESEGLGPAQLDIWLGQLKKGGYIETEFRQVDDCRLPFWVVTDAGRDKMK